MLHITDENDWRNHKVKYIMNNKTNSDYPKIIK